MDAEITNLIWKSETDLAVLVQQGIHTCWIPRSQISYMLKDKDNNLTIKIPEWLAEKKRLDY